MADLSGVVAAWRRDHTLPPTGGDIHAGQWGPPLSDCTFVCGNFAPEDLEPAQCDCGFVGEWHHRWVYRSEDLGDGHLNTVQVEKGFPPLPAGKFWLIDGFDEQCPRCGDIERFDVDGKLTHLGSELAEIVPMMRPSLSSV